MSSESTRRPSIWRRFWNRIFPPVDPRPVPPPVLDPPPTPAPRERVYYRPHQAETPILALCRGDVFEFRIFADVEWSSKDMRYEELVRQAGEYAASVGDDLRRRVWQTARRFGPHEAARAEAKLRHVLGSWCYETDAGRVRCAPFVRVTPDPRVQDHLKPYVLHEIEADSRATLARQRIELLREIVGLWSKLVTDLGVSPVKLGAARLADDDFATVLRQVAEHRRLSTKELVDIIGQASDDHRQLGMYEFAEMYASAVDAYQRQMEVKDSEFIAQVMNIEPSGSSR